jgi:hypothetical protein
MMPVFKKDVVWGHKWLNVVAPPTKEYRVPAPTEVETFDDIRSWMIDPRKENLADHGFAVVDAQWALDGLSVGSAAKLLVLLNDCSLHIFDTLQNGEFAVPLITGTGFKLHSFGLKSICDMSKTYAAWLANSGTCRPIPRNDRILCFRAIEIFTCGIWQWFLVMVSTNKLTIWRMKSHGRDIKGSCISSTAMDNALSSSTTGDCDVPCSMSLMTLTAQARGDEDIPLIRILVSSTTGALLEYHACIDTQAKVSLRYAKKKRICSSKIENIIQSDEFIIVASGFYVYVIPAVHDDVYQIASTETHLINDIYLLSCEVEGDRIERLLSVVRMNGSISYYRVDDLELEQRHTDREDRNITCSASTASQKIALLNVQSFSDLFSTNARVKGIASDPLNRMVASIHTVYARRDSSNLTQTRKCLSHVHCKIDMQALPVCSTPSAQTRNWTIDLEKTIKIVRKLLSRADDATNEITFSSVSLAYLHCAETFQSSEKRDTMAFVQLSDCPSTSATQKRSWQESGDSSAGSDEEGADPDVSDDSDRKPVHRKHPKKMKKVRRPISTAKIAEVLQATAHKRLTMSMDNALAVLCEAAIVVSYQLQHDGETDFLKTISKLKEGDEKDAASQEEILTSLPVDASKRRQKLGLWRLLLHVLSASVRVVGSTMSARLARHDRYAIIISLLRRAIRIAHYIEVVRILKDKMADRSASIGPSSWFAVSKIKEVLHFEAERRRISNGAKDGCLAVMKDNLDVLQKLLSSAKMIKIAKESQAVNVCCICDTKLPLDCATPSTVHCSKCLQWNDLCALSFQVIDPFKQNNLDGNFVMHCELCSVFCILGDERTYMMAKSKSPLCPYCSLILQPAL